EVEWDRRLVRPLRPAADFLEQRCNGFLGCGAGFLSAYNRRSRVDERRDGLPVRLLELHLDCELADPLGLLRHERLNDALIEVADQLGRRVERDDLYLSPHPARKKCLSDGGAADPGVGEESGEIGGGEKDALGGG